MPISGEEKVTVSLLKSITNARLEKQRLKLTLALQQATDFSYQFLLLKETEKDRVQKYGISSLPKQEARISARVSLLPFLLNLSREYGQKRFEADLTEKT